MPVLQTAISPVILVSGIGLFLLSMTNRLDRAIDRARIIDSQLAGVGDSQRPSMEAQLSILWKRARVIRACIILSAGSALSAALLVILIFISALTGINAGWFAAGLFTLCMLLLIASLALFIHDINQSCAALKLELQLQGLGDS